MKECQLSAIERCPMKKRQLIASESPLSLATSDERVPDEDGLLSKLSDVR